MAVVVVLLLAVLPAVVADCANGCNGHGNCNTLQSCDCVLGWTGADCSRRQCPVGRSWYDLPTAIDVAHNPGAECSNMGHCDQLTGLCTCAAGFEGMACERMSCPRDESGVIPCSGHGRCLSVEQAARIKDDVVLFNSYSYNLWDANMIHGCVCDEGWTNFDCSLRTCPKGDDPLTSGVDEIQVIDCVCQGTCSGTFTLAYAGYVTAPIAFNAVALVSDEDSSSTAGLGVGESVQAKLQALPSLDAVLVTMTGSGTCPSCPVCDATGVSTAITFTHTPGSLPALVPTSSLASTTATPTLAIRTKGTAGDQGGQASVTGTRENIECSGRGICDDTIGVCTCSSTFSGSNGAGGSVAVAAGTRDDCGYTTGTTACPVDDSAVECSGHGTCSGASTYKCTCLEGYTGANCGLLSCPFGRAWLDEASAVNTAHAQAECSNRGLCDRTTGLCTCQVGFDGTACQRTACPMDSKSIACSAHGTCRSMALAAPYARVNGELTGMTYGATNAEEAWDKDSIYGCHCDTAHYNGPWILSTNQYKGFDCSRRTCPTGDDPNTVDQVHEKQVVRCTGTGGTFTLTFRSVVSDPIAYNAVALTSDEDTSSTAGIGVGESVQSKLAKLVTYDSTSFSVATTTVSFSTGSAACAASPVDITITLLNELGDPPMFTADTSLLTGSPAIVIFESVKGTMENALCSNRGLCDETAGVCRCFEGYTSSDGSGGLGNRGDCGYMTSWQTSNPYPIN